MKYPVGYGCFHDGTCDIDHLILGGSLEVLLG